MGVFLFIPPVGSPLSTIKWGWLLLQETYKWDVGCLSGTWVATVNFLESLQDKDNSLNEMG